MSHILQMLEWKVKSMYVSFVHFSKTIDLEIKLCILDVILFTMTWSVYFIGQSSFCILTYLLAEGVVSNPSRYWTENVLDVSGFILFLTQHNVINQKQQNAILTYKKINIENIWH